MVANIGQTSQNQKMNKSKKIVVHPEGDRPRSAGSVRTVLTGLQTLPVSVYESSKGFENKIQENWALAQLSTNPNYKIKEFLKFDSYYSRETTNEFGGRESGMDSTYKIKLKGGVKLS